MRTRMLAGSLCAVALLLAAASPQRSRADAQELAALSGTWIYADGDRGLRRIARAVDQSVQGMSFFVAPIARELVRGRTVHARELRIEIDDDVVRFGTESWGPVATRLGADPIPIVAPDGTEVVLTHRSERGRLVQLFAHPDGARENTFALSGDRQWLWMGVRIYSPRLPRECRYRLRYRRRAERASSVGR